MKEPHVDPRALLTFRSVAHHGSFSSAARELGWSQPALSQQVRKLEQQVGTAILERSPRGITLTESGRLLLAHADAMHARLVRASSEMAELMSQESRKITVAAFPSACTSIVAPIMSFLMATEQASRIDLSLIQREPAEAVAPLLTGEIDLALVFRYEFESGAWEREGITSELLGREPLMMLIPRPRGVEVAGDVEPCGIEEFAGERWVSGCELCRHNLLHAAERAGFEPNIQHSTDDSRVVQELVSRGHCVALVSYLSLLGSDHPGTIARPLRDPSHRELLLLSRSEVPSPQVARVAEQLRQSVARALSGAAFG